MQAYNFTYNTDVGGFADDNQMSIDPRGFKHIIQAEAAEFLQPHQLRTNSTVKTIKHSDSGVSVVLVSGEVLHADYVLCTFSLGVLQNDDVVFEPALPDWKEEAIQSMTMVGRLGHEKGYAALMRYLRRPRTRRSSCSLRRSSGSTLRWATRHIIRLPFNRRFLLKVGLYADPERGRYPLWQSLDHENFLPGSGIVFVTTTVRRHVSSSPLYC